MNRNLVFVAAGLLNLITFLLHYAIFRESKGARKTWAACTAGAGFGHFLYYFPEFLFGSETNVQAIWLGILVCITGIGLYLLNRYDMRFTIPN